MKYPKELDSIISYLRKFPGVGLKTAERFAFQLLHWNEKELSNFSNALSILKQSVTPCSVCGSFLDGGKCLFCENPYRDRSKLCILSSVKDIYQIEKTKSFQGLYHVLEELISPLDGSDGENINIEKLQTRIQENKMREVIIALDSTLEGDTTALFIKKHLQDLPIKMYRLAFGLPVGSSIEYIDGNTLVRALSGKQAF